MIDYPPNLTPAEVKKVREVLRWYRQMRDQEESQYKLEEMLANVDTGDGW